MALETDPRAVLFNRLRTESPEYRVYFLTRLTDVLNHELTPQFMNDLITRYERQADVFGVENDVFFNSLRQYAVHRPGVLRAQMDEYFQSGPSRRLTVSSAPQLGIAVDGRSVGDSYTGSYFRDTPARIELSDPAQAARVKWTVNGRTIDPPAGPLLLNLTADTSVEILPAH